MRVLLVLGTSAGGVGRHVQGLVGSLAGAGHEVVVACPPAVEAQFGLSGLATSYAPVDLGDRPHPARDAIAVRDLRRLVDGADVVHAHGLRAAALGVLAASRRTTPLVATLHNAAPTGAFTGTVYAALERVVALRADLVLGVSADLVDRMTSLGARNVGLAVVAAPAPRAATRDRYAVRADLGVGGPTSLGVVVARLAPQKGLDVLLDAHGEIRGTDLVTVVAGDGPERAALQKRIDAESLPVRLLGLRDDVPDLLGAADVVISSAVWEGQPVGLQEALHAGAAIVATDVGGTGAVVGDAALLVPRSDPISLSRALRDVVLNDSVREHLRSKAMERSAELPTPVDALEAAMTAYESVLRGRPRPGG